MVPRGVDTIADRLELVRSALVGVLSVGLSQTAEADPPCPERLAPLSATFTAASADVRTHTLCNYTSLSSAKGKRVMCDMVNHDLRPWVNELRRFTLRNQLPVVPPPPDTMLEQPPIPVSDCASTFCRGGGELLKIVEETSRGTGVRGEGSFKRKAASGPSLPDAWHTTKKSIQFCNMYEATGRCKWRDCN